MFSCSAADAPLAGAWEDRKLIALTFDDGPRRATTTRLLDGLAERGVKATFFLIGAQVEHNEDVIRRMDREGHQIGIHTYDHVQLTGLNQADFAAQVDKLAVVEELDPIIEDHCRALGLEVVGKDVLPMIDEFSQNLNLRKRRC